MNDSPRTDGRARRSSASLRDPAGYVFERDGRIFRRLYASAAAVWTSFAQTPLAQSLMAQGRLVPTWAASQASPADYAGLDAPGATEAHDTGLALEHERIEVISHAQEWSFSMLRDAALLHIDLMEALLPLGYTLKDATPANVQFRNGQACLIDVASIEKHAGGAWRAYGQFCRTMLFPLMTSAYARLPLPALMKGHGADGMPASTASRLLKGQLTLRPGVLVHVRLQAWLHKLSKGKAPSDVSDARLAAAVDVSSVIRLLQGLRRALTALPLPPQTSWTGYRSTSTYTAAQLIEKRSIVEQWCAAHLTRQDVALDVGCNTGDYSRLLAKHAKLVVAIDADAACVDELHRTGEPNVLPLVVDFAAPTPAAGWALREQASFFDRVRPDWSIWLAVIHHLAIHNGVRLDDVVDRMLQTSRWLVVEFVAPEDEMVQALLKERAVERMDYSEANFRLLLAVYGAKIHEVREVTPTRTLYLLERG